MKNLLFLLLSIFTFAQTPKVSFGKIIEYKNFKSDIIGERTVRIWLPENYNPKVNERNWIHNAKNTIFFKDFSYLFLLYCFCCFVFWVVRCFFVVFRSVFVLRASVVFRFFVVCFCFVFCFFVVFGRARFSGISLRT